MSRQDTIGTHKTHIETDAEGVHVRYHATRVASLAPDGTITLRTGGWRTVTTKKRMNQALATWGSPYRVYQEDHEWYVQPLPYGAATPFHFDSDTLVLP